jgi:hypothetical protein
MVIWCYVLFFVFYRNSEALIENPYFIYKMSANYSFMCRISAALNRYSGKADNLVVF